MEANETLSFAACESCGSQLQITDRFCGNCGKEHSVELERPPVDVYTVLSPSLIYYFITLALLAVYKLTPAFEDDFESFLFISAVDVLIVVWFAIYAFKDLVPLFSIKNFRLSIACLTVLSALAGSVFISWFANILNLAISDDVFYNTYLFADTSYPFLFATLLLCVQPAIFEEVAFRGFLFNNIQKLSTPKGTVYITSFIFGILHLAIVSMLWLVPIGLAFAFLRLRYNTIWYGVIGHFTYNFGITAIEFFWPELFLPY